MSVHHMFLVILQQRHVVYLLCAIVFTLGAVAFGIQPYFSEVVSKAACVGVMFGATVAGLAFTSFLRHCSPHREISCPDCR